MKITPVKGTNDYLPRETALRDALQSEISAKIRERWKDHYAVICTDSAAFN